MPYLNDEAAEKVEKVLREPAGELNNEEECLLNSMRGQGLKCEPFRYDNEFGVLFPDYDNEYAWLLEGELVYIPRNKSKKARITSLVMKLQGVSEHSGVPLRA